MKKINNIKQFLFVLLAFAFVGINQAWGYSSSKLTVNISGSGKVAITTSASAPSEYSESSVSAEQGPHGFWDTYVTDYYYIWVIPNAGYYCSGVTDCTWNGAGYYTISIKGKTATEKKTVTATFVGNTYYVAFDGNGNDGGRMNKQKYTYGTAAALTNNAFTRTGYTFAGWNTKSNGTGTSYTNKQSVNNLTTTADATVTLYAQWTPNTYYVAFNGNGSTDGSMSNQAFTYDADVQNLSENSFARAYTVQFDANDGQCDSEPLVATYTFVGWATAADGAVVYANQAAVKNLTSAANGVYNVYAKWKSGAVTLPNATIDQQFYHLEGWYLNDERVGEAGTVYTPTADVTLSARWTMESFDPVITGANTAMSVGDEQENAFVFEHTENPIAHIEVTAIDPINDGSGKVIEFDASTNSIIARNAGTATIYFEQVAVGAINAGTSATYTYTVTKNEPSFSLNKTEIVLDQAAILTLTKTDNATIDIAPEGSLEYNAETGELTGRIAGTATVTVTQEETYYATAKQETFELNVLKKTPKLSVSLNGFIQNSLTLQYNETATFAVEKESDAEVEVETLDGSAYVTLANGTFKALYGVGTAHFRASLRETDTYLGKSVDFSISVTASTGYLPLFNESGYIMGNPAWTSGFNYVNDSKTLEFQGIPDKLSFSYYYYTNNVTKGDADYMMYVEESANGQNWSKIWDNSEPNESSQSSGELQLQKTTHYLRFNFSGNYGAYYTNIRITDLKYVDEPEPKVINLGTQAINSGEVSATSLINWCNTAPLKVTCSNPRFTVTPESFGNYLQYGSQELTIKYTHTNEVGANEGDITISNGIYTKTIHVLAETTKRPQTISWNDQLAATGYAMNVGETFPSEALPYVAYTANGELVTFTSDNTDVIEIIDDTVIVAKAVGTANITAYQAGDAEYQEVSGTVLFTVTNLLKQSITWEQNLLMLLTTSGEVELTATATSGGEVTYASADESVVRIQGNKLIVSGEGETYITATQAGGEINGEEYIPASMNNNVIVRNPASQCNSRALSVGSLTLNSSKLSQEYTLSGTPQVLTFSAKHGTKSGSFIGFNPVYSELIVEQYAFINNLWDWYKVYNKVVGTDATASGNITLDESAKKIRFRTTETGTDHTITNVNVTRMKYMRSDVSVIDLEVESNAIWEKTITVSHSNIDLMTVTAKQGLLNLSSSTLGGGCGSYGDDAFVASFTPMQKYVDYYDTIVITDGKAQPSTIEIPVHLYSKGLNQAIEGFVVPETAWTTDEIPALHATATSNLPVIFATSDENIARIVNDSVLQIITEGTVDVYAIQAGDSRYDSTAVARTLVISKVTPTVGALPMAAEITYGQTLAEATLTGGEASVPGTFAWADEAIVPEVGTHEYTVIFTPVNTAWYNTATANVAVSALATAAELKVAPVAFDTLVYTGEPQVLIEAGEAQGGTLLYSLGDIDHFADTLPTAVEVGEYKIYYYVAGDENHSNTLLDSLSVAIAPEEPVLTPQTITWEWDADNDTIEVEDQVYIDVYATSNMEVTITISDETKAVLMDNWLNALAAGTITVTATQDGNDVWAAAEPVVHQITIIDPNAQTEPDPQITTAVDELETKSAVTKIIRDNQVLIIRAGRTYTATGLLVE